MLFNTLMAVTVFINLLVSSDWVEVCHEYKEYPYLDQEHHPRPENKKHKTIRVPTTMPTTMPTMKTETRKTNQVTGVVIGTGCGLVFLCLTFLALCHSRRCRRLCLQKEVEKYSDHADVVEEEGPPVYCDVMASLDKFPKTTDSTNNSEELPPYPGLPQNDNMIPKTSQQSLNDAGYISQEIEEDVLEKSATDATESSGENSQNASTGPPEISANEQEIEVSIEEAEETNVAADDEKAAKEKVENAEFIDDDKSTWDVSETQDFQHPKSINTVV
ncbi:immunoglobulin A1 protease autotransporter-like isoform X2 [Xenia sp. Carnegie-2017]|uniref:immunoglobulin A1 protease autotransporter-like isoform X2 n=1 Tax=Xenia sp. Carnegie-2017 TaxID=2897299 RepID=UPI001F0401D9|nr:immunoglobulin A1 protease autotransporter-like isoform X2 [Xenia sp. Carnegie-2017]